MSTPFSVTSGGPISPVTALYRKSAALTRPVLAHAILDLGEEVETDAGPQVVKLAEGRRS